MLAPAHRLRRSGDFATVVRSGARARRGCLVVHQQRELSAAGADPSAVASSPALVGLVVGRSVGGSVVRHRVSRRLRAQLAQRLPLLAPGSATVVRALPAAAEADSVTLGRDLDAALRRVDAAGRRNPDGDR